jgi:hypothetical protein
LISNPELTNDSLEKYPHYYFEIDEEGEDNFSIFIVNDENSIPKIRNELLKDTTNLYQFIFFMDFKKFIFSREIPGASKVVVVKKKYSDLNQIFLDKLDALKFDDFDSFEDLFDRSEIIKEFYDFYIICENYLKKNISGIPNELEKGKIAQIILNRIMFLWFLQVKGFLNDDFTYLKSKFDEFKSKNYYSDFLRLLFFEGLCISPNERRDEINKLIGKIPYLNGGLFLPTEEEIKYEVSIKIPNNTFYKLLNYPFSSDIDELPVLNLMESKKWALDERTGEIDEINPEILGFIFEKSINQKSLGAVYTPEFITSIMCEDSIINYLNTELNNVNSFTKFNKYKDILKLKKSDISNLVLEKIKNVKIIDPACGSGHFLVDMLFHLEKIYLVLEENPNRSKIRENIILNNLFGTDILPKAVEITKLRLFLVLAESFENVNQIIPLPNIDFYMRSGNSVLGFFERKEGNLFDFFDGSIGSLISERNSLIKSYEKLTSKEAINKRQEIIEKTLDLEKIFTLKLIEKLKIKNTTYDEMKKNFFPFHWSMEFSEIFLKNKGFDIIIGNPPYVKSNEIDYRDFITEIKDKSTKIIFKKTSDLSCYFLVRGVQLLKDKGILNFIITNKVFVTDYGKPVREYLKENTKIVKIYDLEGKKVFKGVSVETEI